MVVPKVELHLCFVFMSHGLDLSRFIITKIPFFSLLGLLEFKFELDRHVLRVNKNQGHWIGPAQIEPFCRIELGHLSVVYDLKGWIIAPFNSYDIEARACEQKE